MEMSAKGWRETWVAERCATAIAIGNGAAGGGYAEAIILLSSVASALAAEVWPGAGIDRARFVELFIRFPDTASEFSKISVPLLIQDLERTDRRAAEELAQALGFQHGTKVLTGVDIDRTEAEILDLAAAAPRDRIRRFSYASVLYGELRSSYVHEYKIGSNAGAWPMTSKTDQLVSYVNRLAGPLVILKLIHFHLNTLEKCIVSAARALDAVSVPCTPPEEWWVKVVPGAP